MKKMIKLSLVAAVAVAGFTTTASAGSLEDAIKGVTISGKMNVEYQATKTDNDGVKSSANVKEYDLDLTANIPVNDMITAQIGVQADHDPVVRDDNTDTADGKTDIAVTKLNFTAKTSVATVIVGKQKQPTPFLDDERGDGVVALIPAGPVTIAAGHFTGVNGGATSDTATADAKGGLINLNLSKRDISALALIGAAGPVNYSAWYVTASSANGTVLDAGSALGAALGIAGANTNAVEKGLDAYTVNLNGKFGPVSVDATYSSAKLDAITGSKFDAETLLKVTAAMKVDAINLTAGYAQTNDSKHDLTAANQGVNARLHGVDLTSDNDAKTNMAMEILDIDSVIDAKAFLVGASTTFGKTTLSATYLNGDSDAAELDFAELDLKATYAMSKNFSLEAVYAMSELDFKADANDLDTDTALVRMTYKF